MNNYIIYAHINKINNKVYVGQTCQNPEKRWDYGSGYKKHNLHFYNAIKKYGWKEGFEHIILETGLSAEEANERERYYIKYYNSLEPNGYNLTAGGDGSLSHTTSRETKEKIGRANGKEVHCLETDEYFYSTAEAARYLGLVPGHISDACIGTRMKVDGLHWEYVEHPWPGQNNEEKIAFLLQKEHKNRSKPIRCIELDKNFDSAVDASKEFNVSRSSLCRALKQGSRCKGYHWEYI